MNGAHKCVGTELTEPHGGREGGGGRERVREKERESVTLCNDDWNSLGL